jgi:hypothetical protein
MILDDRLKKAVDTLGDRLRDEIARELLMVTEELSAEARAEREVAVQAAIASVQSAIVSSQPPARESTVTRLLDAIRAIDEARSLTAVLDALVARAALETSRAGALLVRADRVRGWRDEDLDVPLAETGIVADAVRTGFAASTTATGLASLPFAGAAAGAEIHAFPLALSGDVVAVLYAEGGDAGTLEILARHGARVLEALTAFKTARAVAGASSVGVPPVETHMPAADDEEAAARRYARLLISEIKLYHQDAVEAGRRDRDLFVRLGGEIAHARSLYGERVPAHVRHAADYFRDELVRTLAGGDASLLVDVSAA